MASKKRVEKSKVEETIEETVINVVVTPEVIEDNTEVAEVASVGETIQVEEECADDCVCHEDKSFAINDKDAESALTIMHENGGLELKEDGMYVNGVLTTNPTKVYNALYAYQMAYYKVKQV